MTSYVRARGLNFLNFYNRLKSGDIDGVVAVAKAMAEGRQDLQKALERIFREAEEYRNLLEEVQKKRPEWMEPLMMAVEYTDGKVSTIEDL